MKPEYFEVIAKASQMFTSLSGFAKNNPAIETPATKEEYQETANELMEILRSK